MTTKLEAIRQKCIEANPEIVELKFGCEVSFDDGVSPYIGQICDRWELPDEGWYAFKVVGDTHEYFVGPSESDKPDELVGVIGRPIRLADVLLAILRKDVRAEKYEEPPVWNVNEKTLKLLSMYDLRNDDLSQQSPETIDFIGSILGV